MPYTIQARMSQFGDCTDHAPHTVATFEGALLYLKEYMLYIKAQMNDYLMPRYTNFNFDKPIEEVTSLPEQEELEIYFGSSHSNCELWVFTVKRSE